MLPLGFSQLARLGHVVDLDEVSSDVESWAAPDDHVVEGMSEAETIPGDVVEHTSEAETIVIEPISEAETIPGDPDLVECIEVSDSSDVEILEVLEPHKQLSPDEEIERMRAEERYGHLHRIEHRQAVVHSRLRAVFEAIACESVEDRCARRERFRQAVHGSDWALQD